MLTLSQGALVSGRLARLATLILFLTVQGAVEARAQAQNVTAPAAAENGAKAGDANVKPANTTPQAEFQYSALTGSGNTMLATRVPAVTSTGVTLYWDVTLLFDVDSNGNLTLASGYPLIVSSPILKTAGFAPGNYAGPSNINGGQNLITVSGPGVGPGGTTQWSLSASAGASGATYPDTATWYVGPYSTSPLQARLKAAGISASDYPNYSWGTGDSGSDPNLDWTANSLLAFSQVGDTITILSFTNDFIDYNVSRDSIVYTCTSGACAAK